MASPAPQMGPEKNGGKVARKVGKMQAFPLCEL